MSSVMDRFAALDVAQERRRLFGAYPALVTDIKDPDGQGRIKIKLPWSPDPADGSYQVWARISVLMAGNNRGSWFIPDPNDEVLLANITRGEFVSIEESHTFSPRLVNSVRFGFNRSVHICNGVSAINPLAANTALGDNPGADTPQVDIPGLVSIQPGLNQQFHRDYFNNSF